MRFTSLLCALLLALLLQSPELAYSSPSHSENSCYERADRPDFAPPVVEVRYRTLRGYRRCRPSFFRNRGKWFQCLVERARPSRKVMQIFELSELPFSLTRGSWGNLGWARQNVFAIPSLKTHFESATLIARGLEWDEILALSSPAQLYSLLDDHNSFVYETKCVRRSRWCRRVKRRGGRFCSRSFNEQQWIPADPSYPVTLGEAP